MNIVFAAGPFPPPTHGMSKNLLALAMDVGSKAKVVKLNTSPGTLSRGPRYHATKILRVLVAITTLIAYSALHNKRKRVFYIAPDAGYGGWYSLALILLAKWLCHATYIHHRSFAYLNKKKKFMQLIHHTNPTSTHILLCNRMLELYSQVYGAPHQAKIVDNFHYVDPIPDLALPPIRHSPLTLGFLSNLGFDKGLQRVVSFFESLIADRKGPYPNIQLIVAGPFEDQVSEEYLLSKLGPQIPIEYMGYVDPERKKHFYSLIDVFLFPSTYSNEAQPNVLFEAAAFGVPVITLATGCIQEDIDQSLGVVYSTPEEYAECGRKLVERYIAFPDILHDTKLRTLATARQRCFTSRIAYSKLIEELTS